MSAFWKCDGCGIVRSAARSSDGRWVKPWEWFSRADEEGIQDACSRDCVDEIAKKSSKTNVILPL